MAVFCAYAAVTLEGERARFDFLRQNEADLTFISCKDPTALRHLASDPRVQIFETWMVAFMSVINKAYFIILLSSDFCSIYPPLFLFSRLKVAR